MKLTMPGGDVNHGFCLFEFPFQFWVWRSVVNPVVPRAAAFPQTRYLFSCPIELLFFINHRIYKNDLRWPLLYARPMEPEACMDVGGRCVLLAYDHVRLHDAGLPHPRNGLFRPLGTIFVFG